MKSKNYRHLYKIRRASLRGKEVSIPAGMTLMVGDLVDALYSSWFVLYMPKGSEVDEDLLDKAIKIKTGKTIIP